MNPAEIHVGVLPAHAPDTAVAVLESFARRMSDDVAPVLEEATGARWVFHAEDSTRLSNDDPRPLRLPR